VVEEYVFIPLTFFASIVAIFAVGLYYRNERLKAQAGGGGDYRRIAEEAVQSQQALLEETRRMNKALAEIERLLREV